MSTFFKPYEGSRPFAFISYAHRQSAAVVDTIRILHDRGWRVWYDEGIPAGSDWPKNIAQHMQSCDRVIVFLSKRVLESPTCFSEMRTAARLKKPILTVWLEDAAPEGEWKDILSAGQEIPILDTPEERADAILKSGFLPGRCRKSFLSKIPWRALGLMASLLFLLAAAGAFGALASGLWNPGRMPDTPVTPTPAPQVEITPVPTVDIGGAEQYFAVRFPDGPLEDAVRRKLNNRSDPVFRWQLAEITELYFCGNMILNSAEDVTFEEDGTCRVNGAPVITGQVKDLSLFEDMPRLEKLALIRQPLSGLSGLGGHVLLNELNLSGSTVKDLSGLTELPSLETLRLEHTEVRDLTALDRLPGLKTVTVSRDMLPMIWNDDAGYRVILIKDYVKKGE